MITGFIIYCTVGLGECQTLRSTNTFDSIEACHQEALSAKEFLERQGFVFVGEVCYVPGESA